ncbi:alpha/beta fold hydrolase [Microlunatus ginsengisoli]|uniref:Alpha/beta hydrolase n=1 Tax=Microlunatus ginsengisoli TaxID=363863 RepID=A0ABP6ZGH4_9ACTN
MTDAADFLGTPATLAEGMLDRPGCRVRYWTAGPSDGPAVVLVHGATADHRMFNAQLSLLLGRDYRVVVWDARGHGASLPMPGTPTIDDYVADLFALVDELTLSRPLIVGQSLGSYIAQHAQWHRPEGFRGLVVIGGIATSLPASRSELAVLRSTPAMLRLWPWDNFRRLAARRAALTEPVQAYMADCLAGMDKDTFLRIWHAVVSAVSREGFGPFPAIPVLWVHGDHDDAGAVARHARVLAERGLPNLTSYVVPDAGHNANQDNPDAFNRALAGFLDALD